VGVVDSEESVFKLGERERVEDGEPAEVRVPTPPPPPTGGLSLPPAGVREEEGVGERVRAGGREESEVGDAA